MNQTHKRLFLNVRTQVCTYVLLITPHNIIHTDKYISLDKMRFEDYKKYGQLTGEDIVLTGDLAFSYLTLEPIDGREAKIYI